MLAFESLTPQELLKEVAGFLRQEAQRAARSGGRTKTQKLEIAARVNALECAASDLEAAGILPPKSILRGKPEPPAPDSAEARVKAKYPGAWENPLTGVIWPDRNFPHHSLGTDWADADRKLAPAPLETFLHNDQPMTCPKCGVRTEFIDNHDGTETHTCPGCNFVFLAEEDEDMEAEDEADDDEDYDHALPFSTGRTDCTGTVTRHATLAEAEAHIVEIEKTDPAGVHAGDYFVDGPEILINPPKG